MRTNLMDLLRDFGSTSDQSLSGCTVQQTVTADSTIVGFCRGSASVPRGFVSDEVGASNNRGSNRDDGTGSNRGSNRGDGTGSNRGSNRGDGTGSNRGSNRGDGTGSNRGSNRGDGTGSNRGSNRGDGTGSNRGSNRGDGTDNNRGSNNDDSDNGNSNDDGRSEPTCDGTGVAVDVGKIFPFRLGERQCDSPSHL